MFLNVFLFWLKGFSETLSKFSEQLCQWKSGVPKSLRKNKFRGWNNLDMYMVDAIFSQ